MDLRIDLGLGLLALCATFCASPLAAQSAAAPVAAGFHEQVMGEMAEGAILRDLRGVGDHAAWVEEQHGQWRVMLDGRQQGGAYGEVKYMRLTADGRHLHFFGKREGKWFHVLDGSERSPGYESATSVAVQPQSSSFAYGACLEKKNCHLVVDDKPGGEAYEEIGYPQYSGDGKRLAFFGVRNKKYVAVIDGKEAAVEAVDYSPRNWGFSGGTNRFYAAVSPSNEKWTYLVDDATGPEFNVISPMAFSRDGQHYAYAGAEVHGGFRKQSTEGTVVLDGRAGETHEGSGLPGMWTLAVGAMENAATGPRVMHADFHGVSDPAFSSGGKLTYAIRRDKGAIVVMWGDQAGPALDELIGGIVFSDDPQHWAYIGRRGDSFVEVRDGQAGNTFPIGAKVGWADWIRISSDGSHLAYELVRGGGQFMNEATTRARRSVVLDGHAGKEYNADAMSMVFFSPDYRHAFHTVMQVDGKYDLVVADGAESQHYDELRDLQYSADRTSAVFFARADRRILRVSWAMQ